MPESTPPLSHSNSADNETLTKWQATRRQVRRVWALSVPYFSSEEKLRARILLAAIVVLNLAIVYMNVLFNDWNKLFYDALQEKNADVFWTQLWRFSYLAGGFIVIAVYKFYLTQLLEMRWRAWMTSHYLTRWMSNQVFYRLELARFAPQGAGSTDNPDQRIQEDISQFTSLTISLCMGLLNSAVTLGSFVGILWTLSGAFSFQMAGSEYVVPGFMVWMALIYSIAGSVITHYIGRRQIPLNFEQQRLEAEFRNRMMRVREYSESIALDRGEAVERQQLDVRFGDVLANYLALIRAQKRLTWFTVFFGQAAVVFPFFVAAPRYFSGAIQMGDLMQISSAFGQVQGAMGWFVDNYPSLATWRATTDRLTSFERSFQEIQAPSYLQKATPADGPTAVQASDLSVSLPDGATLVSGVQLQVNAGDSVLLQGPSGSGKSTLFRSLAGIWPYASGSVTPSEGSMYLPQRPYLPNGPLRNALAYPYSPGRYSDAQLSQALVEASLAELANQLDRVDAWTQKLSGGEQQRLALARVLLREPRWIFADEATSALDEATEKSMYGKLSALVQRKHGALVSIAHRPGVAAFHQRKWALVRNQETDGPRFDVTDTAI